MGNAMICGVNAHLREQAEKSDQIDSYLWEEMKKQSFGNHVVLLLGNEKSGKSTMVNQLRISSGGISSEECKLYSSVIAQNIIHDVQYLLSILDDLRDLALTIDKGVIEDIKKELADNFDRDDIITPQLARLLSQLWRTPTIKEAFANLHEFHSLAWYLETIQEIAKYDYVPTLTDVLHSKKTTLGIVETIFDEGNVNFKIVELGGKCSGKRKLMGHFQEVVSVVFCVELSSYDVFLENSNGRENQMRESIDLFKEICEDKFLSEVPIILVFTKTDIFRRKIRDIDLSVCFPEYQSGRDPDLAADFIQDKFFAHNKGTRKIHPLYFCATEINPHTSLLLLDNIKGYILSRLFQALNN
eukprot:TRINITY_DN2262_c0_g1_i2.p1 TRINITY_DN2262_c0_g1~~TRINITY_DN2262_c0_g1_i2.p1  ORF type:complete len:357 (-),score=61.70 TRINITY_DN2262_c0_g1_i2:55-1125(-)